MAANIENRHILSRWSRHPKINSIISIISIITLELTQSLTGSRLPSYWQAFVKTIYPQ